MRHFDKLALTMLVLPNAYVTFLWYFSDVLGVSPGVDMAFAICAGLALDLGAISLLSWKKNSIWKYIASIAFGVGSAVIAYYRYNHSLTSFHGGHLLHTFYPIAALCYMMFLADATNSEAKEQDRRMKEQEKRVREREEYEERMRREEERKMFEEGKVKCSKCGKWFKRGRSYTTHSRQCKGN